MVTSLCIAIAIRMYEGVDGVAAFIFPVMFYAAFAFTALLAYALYHYKKLSE